MVGRTNQWAMGAAFVRAIDFSAGALHLRNWDLAASSALSCWYVVCGRTLIQLIGVGGCRAGTPARGASRAVAPARAASVSGGRRALAQPASARRAAAAAARPRASRAARVVATALL